jgi:peroxygenase
VIWPSDTYVGLRAFGWSVPLCLYATFLINGFLSYPTLPTFLPDPFFRIYTQRMHKAKHGSDSMSYDNEGRFRPQNFEDFFAKYDKDGKGGMTARELWGAWRGQMLVGDVFGCGAAFLECELD